MFKITLVIIALFIVSCGTQENEQITPNVPQNKPQPARPKSARVADECESVSYGNGLKIDACEVTLGDLTIDTYIDGNGFPYSMYTEKLVGGVVLGAGINLNPGEVSMASVNNAIGTESRVNVTNPQLLIQSLSGTIDMVQGTDAFSNLRLQIDANGYIKMPQLKARTSSTPVGALYDSAGFIKRKH